MAGFCVLLRSIMNQSSTMTDNTTTNSTITDNTMTNNTMTDNTMTDNTMTDNTMTNNTMTDNTIKEMPNTAYNRAIHNMKNKTTNILRGANLYGVLEDSDEECTNNKMQNF